MTGRCQAGRNKLGAGGGEWRSLWLQQGEINRQLVKEPTVL